MQKICSDCGAKTDPLHEECLECGHSQGESTLTWFSFALPIGLLAFLFLCLLIVNQDENIKGASEVQFQGFDKPGHVVSAYFSPGDGSGTWLTLMLIFGILALLSVCLWAEDS